jgi:hypothetical protein
MNFLDGKLNRRKYILNKEILCRGVKTMKDIQWGSPASLACLGIFLGGLGIFFYAIWSTFLN